MKRSYCCEGQYCQLCWSFLLLHGTTLSLFHGDQFGQSNLRGRIWSSSHPVINNISCRVAQPCRRCLPGCNTKSLWPTHLLQWRPQTNQLHCSHYGTSCNGKGLQFSRIDLIVSALAPSQLLKVVAQSPIVVRGLLLPCTVYATLMWLVFVW